jgi:glycosyltransferase involved in cell wall biosynthesis
MKVLWMSDSPTSPSGFGNVTRFVCDGLSESGHHVSILGWQTRGSLQQWRNCTLYPIRRDNFGADVLLGYLQRIQPDVLITLSDVWWLSYVAHPVIANLMRTAGIPWVLYYPIDGDRGHGELPPSWVRMLHTVDLPVAMSRYGLATTKDNSVDAVYIPHGVDLTIFRPPNDKTAAKVALGYEGSFVVLSDARNQPRKLLPRTLEIFRRFAVGKPDVVLHMHCDPDDPAARSREYHYDLRADIDFLDLRNKVHFTPGMTIDAGIPIEKLASLYQASDVHLLSSWGEGFGLPTLQAAAAGVVPLAADHAASRELVHGHGEPIRVQNFVRDQFGLCRALIDIDDAVARLERLYRDRMELNSKSTAAAAFAAAYDWRGIVPLWDQFLRSEVPRRRRQAAVHPAATWVTLGTCGVADRSDLARLVRDAVPSLPGGAQVALRVLQSKAGHLAMQILQDAASEQEMLTIPVTLAPADSALVRERSSGCIFIGGEADVPAVRRLARIFPGLNVWASKPVTLGSGLVSGEPVTAAGVPPSTPAFHRHLAASTLALDLGGCVPTLPAEAAALAVPCIGRGVGGPVDQLWLWPELTLDLPNPEAAAALGRRLLTDQGKVAACCAAARQRLAAASQAVIRGRGS